MFRYGLITVVCLLVASGLIADQNSVGSSATAGAPATLRRPAPVGKGAANDCEAGQGDVSEDGLELLTYNDGTFEYCITWVVAGCELAEMFVAPVRPLTIVKAVVWLAGDAGADYASEVRIYGNDGSPHGYPGTQLGPWVGELHTPPDPWPAIYRNEVSFDLPIEVDYDTFFVSYYQASITPAYPYVGLDTIGNTGHWNGGWGKGLGNWVAPDSTRDPNFDYGIDVYCEAPGSVVAEWKVPAVSQSGIHILFNPSRHGITFRSDADAEVAVFDAAGGIVARQAAAKGLNFLPFSRAGVYFVHDTQAQAQAHAVRVVLTE